MTYLELCQAMAIEAGISGGIVSVSGQVGEAARVVRWVARAYNYIQNLNDEWSFLRRDVQFSTTAGISAAAGKYAAVDVVELGTFGRWRFKDGWRTFLTAAGYADEQPLEFVDYDTFRRLYGYGSARLQTGRPQVVTEAPDRSLLLWPLPNADYTVVGEQYRAPAIMATDTDAPIFDARYHNTVMYRALFYYGQFEGDAPVMATAQSECDRELEPMEATYLPKLFVGGCGALA